VQDMVDMFGGGSGEGVPVLLEFLTVFPEELCENTKIPMSVSWEGHEFRVWGLLKFLGRRM